MCFLQLKDMRISDIMGVYEHKLQSLQVILMDVWIL